MGLTWKQCEHIGQSATHPEWEMKLAHGEQREEGTGEETEALRDGAA